MTTIGNNATCVDFVNTTVSFGPKDGEIVVEMTAKIQTHKFEIGNFYEIWHKRFPNIKRNGCFKVIAKATCGDEEFNYEKGFRIAETRAQKKAYNVASRVYEMIRDYLKHEMYVFNMVKVNCDNCANNAITHLKELDIC